MFNRNTIDVCINHISIPYLWLQVDSKPDATNPESSSIMSEKLHDGGLHFTTHDGQEWISQVCLWSAYGPINV